MRNGQKLTAMSIYKKVYRGKRLGVDGRKKIEKALRGPLLREKLIN